MEKKKRYRYKPILSHGKLLGMTYALLHVHALYTYVGAHGLSCFLFAFIIMVFYLIYPQRDGGQSRACARRVKAPL